ncbi:MAG TPA: hypothetical protein PKG77_09435 [Phycisphaerae bacterium]|nr:hypothetical protein [Phycisphaerae bacterium]HQL71960.1 hypothetical protein [Phycisphaerae bacterium]
MVLWLDAQELARAGRLGDGSPIEHWGDRSGRGHHALQAVAGCQPTLRLATKATAFGAVRFDASKKQHLSVSARGALDLRRLTAFVVARGEAGPANMWLLGRNHWGPPWSGYGIAVSAAGLHPWPHLGLERGGQSANVNPRFRHSIADAFSIVEICFDGQQLIAFQNGSVDSIRPAAGEIRPNDRALLIGAGPQTAPPCEYFQGEIAEVLLYDRALDVRQRGQVREYLARRYAIELSDDQPVNVVSDNGYLPITVTNPATPQTRMLTPAQAEAALERDWLFQAGGSASPERALAEIGWARQLARRLERMPGGPSLVDERAELDALEQRLRSREAPAPPAVGELYLAVRRVKRNIAFKNPALDFSRVLFIDQPYPAGPEARHEAVHRLGHRAVPGGRLLVLDGLHPGGRVRKLAPDRPGSFWRADLSFDARRVVFCYKAHDGKAFHLYETDLNGSPPRQLTDGDYDDVDPIYLPDGHIFFTSTRGNTYVRCGPYIYSHVLARCDPPAGGQAPDGRNVYLISQNSEPDFVPALLNDGRVIYSRWEYSDKDQNRVQSLWTTNQDGTATAAFWGNQSVWPDHLAEPMPIPGSRRVMFAAVGHHDWFTGSIGIVDGDRGTNYPDGLTRVTWDVPWPEVGAGPADRPEAADYHPAGRYTSYKTPYPLSEEDFLVSARGGDGKFRLYLMDVRGNRELIYEGVHNIWHAAPVRPRRVPPRQNDTVAWPGTGRHRTPLQAGSFYSVDVYQGVADLPRGSVKSLRVFQQQAKTYSTWAKVFVFSGPAVSGVHTEAVKRIVTTVPVEADGSVYFEAPAGIALFFQLLDERGRAVHVMRSFTGLLPGERRGCVGCHELRPADAPPNRPALALRRPPTPITPPPWGDQTIGYERFAQGVLDRHCGKCHQGDGEGRKKLDLTLRPAEGRFRGHFKEPYVTLIGPAAWPVPAPGRDRPGYGLAGAIPVYAMTPQDVAPSSLVGHQPSRILQTLRPMHYLSYRSGLIERATSGKHHNVKIDGPDLQRLIAWVDANCPYNGEEELRAMADPDFPGIDLLPVRPRVKTAPVVVRP